MRYMMLVRAPEALQPTPELFAAIDKLSQEMAAKGLLLDTGGLAPSARGARVRVSGGKVAVTDGPFTEAKEIIGGYAVIKASSKAEAIEQGRQFMQLHADILGPSFTGEVEIREMADAPAGH